jgi:iron complex transport system permease protein
MASADPVTGKAATARRVLALSGIAALVLAAAIVAGMLHGATKINLGRVLSFDPGDLDVRKVFGYRLPRALASAIIGGALSLAGLLFQALIRNPLASPYVLGVSTGGSLGAVIAITTGFLFVPGAAFAGSCAAILLIYGTARSGGRIPSITLLLSGVVLNAFFSAAIMFVNLIAAPRDQDRILRWLIGGLADHYEPGTLVACAAVVAATAAAGLLWSRELNLLSLSETDADRAGVRVNRFRTGFFILGSLLTAVAVTISGPIAFVGLIVPHVVRLLVGPDHRLLVPLCVLGGGAFVVLVDMLAQTVWSVPLPAGVITAFLGGPFFLVLLRRRDPGRAGLGV